MNTTAHHAGLARRFTTIVIGIALLTSCAGSDASSAADAASTTSYTINAGDTLSDIAEKSGISLGDLVNANEWPDGSNHLILPGDVITLPQGATAPTPNQAGPAATTATPPSGGVTASSGGYEPSPSPNPASLATNQKSDPIVAPLPDGQYWSWNYTSDGDNVSFTLVQYFFGDACRKQFGTADEACASDNGTLYEPSATVRLTNTAATSVVTCCDNSSQFGSYRVSTSEFVRLVAGLTPAADAPTDFAYATYAVVVTVQNGQAVAAHQIFTS